MFLYSLVAFCTLANASTITPRSGTSEHSKSSIQNHLQMLRDALKVSQSSCIEFFVGDTFGTGWKYSKLLIYDDEGNFDSYSPNKTSNHMNVKYCYNTKSRSLSKSVLGSHIEKKTYPSKNVTLSIAVQYFRVIHSTSLIWSARNLKTGDLYTGNHLTKMVFRFQDSSISFGYGTNLVSSHLNPSTCMACSTTSAPTMTDSGVELVRGASSPVAVAETGLQPVLYGFADTWFRSDGLGSTYEISDVSGAEVYYAGQLCSGEAADPPCPVKLPPGQYLWRVNGALDPHKDSIAWTFCDSQGGVQTELLFEIDDSGHCIPGKLSFALDGDIAETAPPSSSAASHVEDHEEGPSQLSPLVLQGAIDLTGLNSVIISEDEKRAFERLLTAQVLEARTARSSTRFGAVEHTAKLFSWQAVAPETFNRRGKGEVKLMGACDGLMDRVTFSIPISRDDFLTPQSKRLSPSSPSSAEDDAHLLKSFKRFLGIALESGAFLAKIHQRDNSNLNLITKAKLVELEIISDVDLEEYNEQLLMDGVLLVAVCLGLFAGVALSLYRSYRSKWTIASGQKEKDFLGCDRRLPLL